MNRPTSERLFAEALELMPGGVSSPVRAFRAVGGTPFFAQRAAGARIWDVDGHEYIDYVGSWGPAIHGHAYPPIIEAIQKAAEEGTSFGVPGPREIHLARRIREMVPAVEKVRFTSSGTEACMASIRLARGITRRDRIIKFAGCYHGHADALLVKAGSGALTFGHPDSAGVPTAVARETLVLPFNDPDAVEAAFARNGPKIAAVILEPLPANAGLFLPRAGFLEVVRRLTRENGSLLIFDEVITGFRLGPAGAQGYFGIEPDLTCFGKIIGGGLPVGAVGGRARFMDHLAPVGSVYQAGTLSGNPLAMAAGIASLEALQDGAAYRKLEDLGRELETSLRSAAQKAGIPVQVQRLGSLFCAYFTARPVWNLEDAMTSDRSRFARYFHGMLNRGIYFAPSQFEAGFLGTAHSATDIEATVRAATESMADLGRNP
jgi:glutamate-1-semialdehyde 2,1-aminomutase